jgi:hypothetical protein
MKGMESQSICIPFEKRGIDHPLFPFMRTVHGAAGGAQLQCWLIESVEYGQNPPKTYNGYTGCYINPEYEADHIRRRAFGRVPERC